MAHQHTSPITTAVSDICSSSVYDKCDLILQMFCNSQQTGSEKTKSNKKTEPKTFMSGQSLDIDAWVCGACKHFHNTINNMLQLSNLLFRDAVNCVIEMKRKWFVPFYTTDHPTFTLICTAVTVLPNYTYSLTTSLTSVLAKCVRNSSQCPLPLMPLQMGSLCVWRSLYFPLAKEEQQLLLTTQAKAPKKRWTSGPSQEGGGMGGQQERNGGIKAGR